MNIMKRIFIAIVPWYNVKQQASKDERTSSCLASARRAINEAEVIVVQYRTHKG